MHAGTQPALIAVAILTEADARRGYGHLGRCCALYDALAELGTDVKLLVRGEVPAHIVEDRAAQVCEWTDAAVGTAALAAVDATVVDSYEADAETYTAIAAAVHAAAFLDDTARLEYPAGLVVNGGIAAAELPYAAGRTADLLLGPAYQLLRRPFWGVPARGAVSPVLGRVLVVFGGGGSRDLLGPTLEALSASLPGVELDVVGAPRSASEMLAAMLRADAAVTAAGQTICELARTGTPTVAVSVADNQLAQARGWAQAGASVFVGTADDPCIAEKTARGLASLSDPAVRAAMSAVGPALIDGRGALRVARALLGRVLDARTSLRAAALGDAAAILALSNDPEVRARSLSTRVISADEHAAWLADRLALPERAVTLLAFDGDELAAQVRFDADGETAAVSISIAGAYRGLGWGPLLLERAVGQLHDALPSVRELVAVVRPENAASRGLFERTGFAPTPASTVPRADGAVEYRRAV